MQKNSLRTEVLRLQLSHGYARIHEHSGRVAAEAAELAVRFGEDAEKAEAAGLLHDIGVVIPEAQRAEFLMIRQIGVLEEEANKASPKVTHPWFIDACDELQGRLFR